MLDFVEHREERMSARCGSRLAVALTASWLSLAGCGGLRSPSVEAVRAAGASADMCAGGTRFALRFDQEFRDNSWRLANGGRWSTQYPWGRENPGALDAAYYGDANEGTDIDPFSIVNGNTLAITARPAPEKMQPRLDGRVYVSGLISTAGSGAPAFEQRYGYYEVRVRLPKGQGLWPSFWMLDSQGARSEIDVFELLGQDVSTIYQSVHRVDGTGEQYPYRPSFDPTAGFHSYGVLVMPATDTYFVDGSATHEITDASTGPFYFMVSLQIGEPDSWPGAPNQTTIWPAHLEIQYFRAYAPTSASC